MLVERIGGGKLGRRRKVGVLEMGKTVVEPGTPMWIENGRRLTLMLVGVTNEAMRPISLSKEWKGIASKVLNELKSI